MNYLDNITTVHIDAISKALGAGYSCSLDERLQLKIEHKKRVYIYRRGNVQFYWDEVDTNIEICDENMDNGKQNMYIEISSDNYVRLSKLIYYIGIMKHILQVIKNVNIGDITL